MTIERRCVPENRSYVAVLAKDLDSLEASLLCGHPKSLSVHSAETGQFLYCELCDDKSARLDAEQREGELLAERDRLRELLRELRKVVHSSYAQKIDAALGGEGSK